MFTLGRKIDLSYRPNQIIAIATLLSVAIGWVVTNEFLQALAIGGGVFSTWALSRELDPKHEYSALVAAALSLFTVIYFDSIQFLVIAWLLLLLRMTNGITGKKLTIIDIVLVLSLSTLLSFDQESGLYLIPFVLAMLYFIVTRERTVLALTAGGIGLGVFIFQSLSGSSLSINPIDFSDSLNLFVITASAVSFLVFWFISKEECEDDKGNRVRRARLFTTQVLFSLTLILLIFFEDISLTNLIIYMSVLTGIIVYYILYILYKQFKPKEAV